MRLQSATIRDFKRFTDLAITDIPETARLIMLAGPNGSGKSSFFDALSSWHKYSTSRSPWQDDYHMKVENRTTTEWNQRKIQLTFHHPVPADAQAKAKLIYARSAFRNDPEFQARSIQTMPDLLAQPRPHRMIDNDATIGTNYQRLAARIFDIFKVSPVMTDEFTEALVKPIRDPLKRLFPELALDDLASPMEDGTFRFTKGKSNGFHFKNLSGGEKAAFDLILDLIVATRSYDDTLFCIDEPESHMNARIQSDLLAVLYDLVPENCQLMLATHSIGMMRRARDIEAAEPGTVVFLDFDGLDFDDAQVIRPAVPDVAFWNRAYDVALADLAALVAPERVVICEGEPKNRNTGANYSHDARCYDRIFQAEFPETRFVPGGNSSEVAEDRRGIAYALGVLTQGTQVVRLIDRNSRSADEVSELIESGTRVLSMRNLESYLFDDEVLRALAMSAGADDAIDALLAKKGGILAARPDDAVDDLKPASGELYLACKGILGLSNPGNDTMTFMRDTLAPLIKPGMQVYDGLRHDIFGSELEPGTERTCDD